MLGWSQRQTVLTQTRSFLEAEAMHLARTTFRFREDAAAIEVIFYTRTAIEGKTRYEAVVQTERYHSHAGYHEEASAEIASRLAAEFCQSVLKINV